VRSGRYPVPMHHEPEPLPVPDRPYQTTAALIRQALDMYEIRHQYRHRAGGPEDPLHELARRFPEPRS